jgi:hypothetical protein
MMDGVVGFSQRVELPNIPEGPGVGIIEDEKGQVLQVFFSSNIRQRIGSMLDSEGITNVHGPKIYAMMKSGKRVFFRWKLTNNYESEKNILIRRLNPVWAVSGFDWENQTQLEVKEPKSLMSNEFTKSRNNREKVLAYLKRISPEEATNAQIVESTGVNPHQQVFMITQDLLHRRLINGRRLGREWFFQFKKLDKID